MYNADGNHDPNGSYSTPDGDCRHCQPLTGPFNSFLGAMIALILIFGSATIVFFLTI